MKASDAAMYAHGLVHASICVPEEWTTEEIEEAANTLQPTGIDSKWKVSTDPTFNGGTPNPCICELQGTRKHYLLVC